VELSFFMKQNRLTRSQFALLMNCIILKEKMMHHI